MFPDALVPFAERRKINMKKSKKSGKSNSRGFSMVEIIIIIAIMAILTAALAPSLIKYVRKAKRATDVDTAGEIAQSYVRSTVEMAEKQQGTINYGSGTDYVRYDSTLSNPPAQLMDYAFAEFDQIPKSKVYRDYYWCIVYDTGTGKVQKVKLVPNAGSDTGGYDLYPNGDAYIEQR